MTDEEKKIEEQPESERTEEKKAKSTGKKEKVKEGDVITVDVDTWIINQDGSEDLFETTDAELAKEHDIFDEKAKYAPITTVVGTGRVVEGLDASLKTAVIGERTVVEIPPEEGAGEWDASKVEIHGIKEFIKQKIDPVPGMQVTFKNKPATIVTVTSGRVRVDFNPPLAGKTVRYEYNVLGKAKDKDEKVLAIIAMDYGESEGFEVKGEGDILEIKLPEICKYDQNWFVMKYRVVGDLREHTDYKTIKFIEEYLKKEDEKPDEPVEEPATKEEKADEPASDGSEPSEEVEERAEEKAPEEL